MSKGLQEGREISFEDDEIRIGRTSENELVLHDHGVSRRHARIFTRGGRLYIVDLGSTGGTLWNGKPLGREKEQELHKGDRLAFGSVEFIFTPLTPPPAEPTRLVPAREVRPRSSTLITRAQTQQEMQAIEKEDTGRHRTLTEVEMGAVEPPTVKLAPPGPAATLVELQVPAPTSTLAEMEELSTTTVKAAPPASRALARAGSTSDSGPAPSAAERARLRRQRVATLGGHLLVWWSELSPKGKSLAGVLAGLVIVVAVAIIASQFRPVRELAGPTGPEPTELGLAPLGDSFGLGEGVTWKRPDEKTFQFQFSSPTRAVAILHYQARDIAQAKEVGISLNGVDLGWVPVDNAEANERELELILPLRVLRRDGPNQLTFDNVRNPPGQEHWRVWNMYVEVIPVPELPVDQLLAKASSEATSARRFYEQKDVGSENLFKSWKLFRTAWITLEALDKKPDLYEDVLYMLAQTAGELDRQCRVLMLDFQRSLQFRDGDKAKATVEEVMRRFPTTEHRCHNLALEKANQYGLPI
ncbi:MAG: FHA domain-containing protein [Hyalangium sp.]|uniref:FHA domain-containing protein n=1 Tax=Hyalangium sp. TaxID=2028555 RepID=UPI0038999BA6